MPNNLPARWTLDCQGKQDFDGELVSLSTRYWPRGGGFGIFTSEGVKTNVLDIRPAAHATIYLGSCEDEFVDAAVPLVEAMFEADTEAEVKQQVEEWANRHWTTICAALTKAFHE